MKVLMTGMTSRGIGSTKLRHDYVSLSDLWVSALQELGHDVDRRRVRVGEDLDRYDAALVLVYWVSSLSTHYSHETAMVLAQMGDRSVLYTDDWRAQNLGHDISYHVVKEEGWARHVGRFRKALYDEMTLEQRDTARAALSHLVDGTKAWPLVVPQHAWGDLSRFLEVDKPEDRLTVPVVGIDPTPLVPLYPITRPRDGDRRRSWVLATVQEHDRWRDRLPTEWGVTQYGGVKKRGGGVNPGSVAMQAHVSEAVVAQAYADNWGMLVPPYESSGSGWWRPRYTFAADALSIVHAPLEDAERLGPAYVDASQDLPWVESLSDSDLRALGEAQREEQIAGSSSYEETVGALEALLQQVAR